MKYPGFSSDIKEYLMALVLGSASLQGFLYLAVGDGMSFLKNCGPLSLLIGLIYCLIPAGTFVIWKRLLRRKNVPDGLTSFRIAGVSGLKALTVLTSALAVVGTGHITFTFLDNENKYVDWGLFASVVILALAILVVVFYCAKVIYQDRLVRKSTDASKLDNNVLQLWKKLNLEFALVLFLSVFAGIFVFENTHPNERWVGNENSSCAKDTTKENSEASNATTCKAKCGQDQLIGSIESLLEKESAWNGTDSDDKSDAAACIGTIVHLIELKDNTLSDLRMGRNFLKLWLQAYVKQSEEGDRTAEAELSLGILTETSIAEIELQKTYLDHYGPDRTISEAFAFKIFTNLNSIRSDDENRANFLLKSLSPYVTSKDPNDYLAVVDKEIEILEQYDEILTTGLKNHLKAKIISIQFDVAIILSVFLLVTVFLWYMNSSRYYSINIQQDQPEANNSEGLLEYSGYFKNVALFLIVLFLPLLKFDPEEVEILEHPFWNISWSDVTGSDPKKEAENLQEALSLTLKDIKLEQNQIQIDTVLVGTTSSGDAINHLTQADRDSIQKMIDEVLQDTKKIHNRVDRPGLIEK